jgi:hypothetical protein
MDEHESFPGNSSSATMTSMPTFAPNIVNSDPCGIDLDTPCSDVAISEVSVESLWMILWVTALVIFLCLPFCISKSRRNLCWRRMKERRWISDDEEDDWYTAAVRRQQEERRQELEARQRLYRTTRTHQDEIREQYLLLCLEKYTMVSLRDE